MHLMRVKGGRRSPAKPEIAAPPAHFVELAARRALDRRTSALKGVYEILFLFAGVLREDLHLQS
ncbi:hypothetical protein BSIN_0221 [Burkholderia singularis]|uniref:Uncharacterized protein n=1 Tax=Burkholderia singularis TaxID=1503053 RepID=A0A238H492_9BURK|nr:hypothetical protein BSIN_0221 [Burkholderia singularis]